MAASSAPTLAGSAGSEIREENSPMATVTFRAQFGAAEQIALGDHANQLPILVGHGHTAEAADEQQFYELRHRVSARTVITSRVTTSTAFMR
jgi:hypothetical protein